jgi:hypothetical protein
MTKVLDATGGLMDAFEGGGYPVGAISMWPNATPPQDWLLCDGSTFNATAYPELAQVLSGNTLPDLTNQFVRGSSPTRAPLTLENDSTALPNTPFLAASTTHTHVVASHVYSHSLNTNRIGEGDGSSGGDQTSPAGGAHTHPITGGDPETRPANIALAFIIKARTESPGGAAISSAKRWTTNMTMNQNTPYVLNHNIGNAYVGVFAWDNVGAELDLVVRPIDVNNVEVRSPTTAIGVQIAVIG